MQRINKGNRIERVSGKEMADFYGRQMIDGAARDLICSIIIVAHGKNSRADTILSLCVLFCKGYSAFEKICQQVVNKYRILGSMGE